VAVGNFFLARSERNYYACRPILVSLRSSTPSRQPIATLSPGTGPRAIGLGWPYNSAFYAIRDARGPPRKTLPATMLRWIAEQVSAAPSSFQGYAERDQTRREHFIELLNEYGWRSFGLHEHRELSTWLMNQARSTDQGMALVLLLIKIFQVRPETLSDLSRSIVFEAKSRFAFTLLPTINNQRKGVGEKTTCFGCLFV
jgi:Domain of unknown function (DUF4158)